jgi:NAD(P)-dependent dehydrogenase (short-subunit alcohol dehydrogenase family)
MGLLDGKTTFISGAGSGIGAAAARRFAAEGSRLILIDVDGAGLGRLGAELGGDRALTAVADVADEEATARVVGTGIERFGRIDVGLLNVGVTGMLAPIAKMPVEAFDATMRTNVRGAFIGLKALLPRMVEWGGGSIVLTASTAGFRAGAPNRSAYVTSKHAVVGLMRAAAAEGAPGKVRVNAISPGGVDTPMTGSLKTMFGEEKAREMLAAFERSIPLGRIAQPDEIADAMLFFASDLSRYCTGTNLMVDGGLMG